MHTYIHTIYFKCNKIKQDKSGFQLVMVKNK